LSDNKYRLQYNVKTRHDNQAGRLHFAAAIFSSVLLRGIHSHDPLGYAHDTWNHEMQCMPKLKRFRGPVLAT